MLGTRELPRGRLGAGQAQNTHVFLFLPVANFMGEKQSDFKPKTK